MRRDLPSGTVTFLFTDVEGSTKLLHELGAEEYAKALAEHRRVLRNAFDAHGGVEVDTQGDAFFVAFPTAPGAAAAAAAAIAELAPGRIQVRIGIHTGTPHLAEEGYVGADVHRAARIAACGHGGQALVSGSTASLLDGENLRELGRHRLKDFDEPVALYQLGGERFPPLKTISSTNLPHPASSFVGREREVEEVAALLRGGTRLVTLTGPGGSGKTRLALEAAGELVPEFSEGVFWVGLAALRDPALVAETIAKTLGAHNGLADHIGEREMLLLLDNLEQVVEAAPELASLIETCAEVRLLVTSRELLRVKGEVEYPVLPLAEPDAVELFCTRARVEPDATVHALCRALDYLPLALELAAARASVLSPKQILERLSQRLDLLRGGRDADPRQQTLRAAIEWSYELLEQDERDLFARLAVFRGGTTLEAAEEVAEAELDALQSLVDKSLLRHTGQRFWMLETIREYAVERLEEIGAGDDVRRRHADWFLALAEEAAPHVLVSPDWAGRLEEEQENFRAALDRLEVLDAGEHHARLVIALGAFWYLKGLLPEGRRRIERVLASDRLPAPLRARALIDATATAIAQDPATAQRWSEEALEIHRRVGDRWGVARSRYMLGVALSEQGDTQGAKKLYEESARDFEELGDERHLVLSNFSLGWMCRDLGDLDRARTLHEDSLRRARGMGDRRFEARALSLLAGIAIDEGRIPDARALLGDAHQIDRETGEVLEIAMNLCRFASALAREGSPTAGVQLLSKGLAVHEELGYPVRKWVATMNEETLALLRGRLDEAQFDDAWKQGRELSVDEAVALAVER